METDEVAASGSGSNDKPATVDADSAKPADSEVRFDSHRRRRIASVLTLWFGVTNKQESGTSEPPV
jgi:hypothetical protein